MDELNSFVQDYSHPARAILWPTMETIMTSWGEKQAHPAKNWLSVRGNYSDEGHFHENVDYVMQ